MNMRILVVVVAIAASVFATATSRASNVKARSTGTPCQIDGVGYDTSAWYRITTVLTDTGELGADFAPMRSALGITGVKLSDLVVISDTIKCRQALAAWKTYYNALGPTYADNASYVQGGLLVRMTPNRYALAVAVFHPYTVATFFVTDSTFAMVSPSM